MATTGTSVGEEEGGNVRHTKHPKLSIAAPDAVEQFPSSSAKEQPKPISRKIIKDPSHPPAEKSDNAQNKRHAAKASDKGKEEGALPTKKYKPYKWLKFTSTKPCCSFCVALWGMLSFLILFGAGVVLLGSSFFPFSTEVPLYLKYSKERMRNDAVKAGYLVADHAPNIAKVQLERSVTKSVSGDLTVKVLYVLDEDEASDIYNVNLLAQIREIEEYVLNHPDYKKYCVLEYTQDEKDIEKEAALTGNYTLVEAINANNTNRSCAAPGTALYACKPLNKDMFPPNRCSFSGCTSNSSNMCYLDRCYRFNESSSPDMPNIMIPETRSCLLQGCSDGYSCLNGDCVRLNDTQPFNQTGLDIERVNCTYNFDCDEENDYFCDDIPEELYALAYIGANNTIQFNLTNANASIYASNPFFGNGTYNASDSSDYQDNGNATIVINIGEEEWDFNIRNFSLIENPGRCVKREGYLFVPQIAQCTMGDGVCGTGLCYWFNETERVNLDFSDVLGNATIGNFSGQANVTVGKCFTVDTQQMEHTPCDINGCRENQTSCVENTYYRSDLTDELNDQANEALTGDLPDFVEDELGVDPDEIGEVDLWADICYNHITRELEYPIVECNSSYSFPAGLLDCNITEGCKYEEMVLSQEHVDTKVAQYADCAALDNPLALYYYQFPDNLFGGGNKRGRALASTFRFGVPLPGYNHSEEDYKTQEREIEKAIGKGFTKHLLNSTRTKFDVWFTMYGYSSTAINNQLATDAIFMAGAFIFVFVYMSAMTGSTFLSGMGMIQVFLCVGPSYMIYYGLLGQRYFGIFQVLSLFIILGIGADDIFVFLDTWNQSAVEPEDVSGSVWTRLSWTWGRAYKAMLVTSATTIASFVSTSTSSFPSISTFGLFAATLVFTNYLAVISYYPTVVTTYERYFKRNKPRRCSVVLKRRLKLCFRKVSEFLDDGGDSDDESTSDSLSENAVWPEKKQEPPTGGPERLFYKPSGEPMTPRPTLQVEEPADMGEGRPRTASSAVSAGSVTVAGSEVAKRVPPAESGASLGRIELFFRDTYFPFLRNHKILIILLDIGFLAFMITNAVKLEPDPESPSIFRPGTNLEEYRPTLVDYFARGASLNSISMKLVFGINPDNPIDRTGTRDTNATDYGVVQFDDRLSLAHGAPCLIELCDILEEKDEEMEIGGDPNYPVECWPKAFRDYIEADTELYPEGHFEAISGVDANVSEFNRVFREWMADTDVFNEWKTEIRSELVEGEEHPVVRFTAITWKLMADYQMNYRLGLQLADKWETWFRNNMNSGICSSVKDHLPGFVECGFFHYYRMSEVMESEAFSGIAISLGVAAFVLVVATHNIIIGLVSTLCIGAIVISVVGFTVLQGWKLGLLESINLVMVPGLSVDYVAHLAEAYVRSVHKTRAGRVRDMLTQVGVSVISGAISTLGATFFLFFPQITFFAKFGQFIFATILFSLFISLTFFSAILLTPIGPQRSVGDLRFLVRKDTYRCKKKKKLKGEEKGKSGSG
mmetsp:Transcript_7171/g.18574  ORF Transcript_7171/g.18574 Transcript_7171/m.18574 type:complete len:1510 (-) Transcript_7171:264-4793(-)